MDEPNHCPMVPVVATACWRAVMEDVEDSIMAEVFSTSTIG